MLLFLFAESTQEKKAHTIEIAYNNNIPNIIPQSGSGEGRAYENLIPTSKVETLFVINPRLKEKIVTVQKKSNRSTRNSR